MIAAGIMATAQPAAADQRYMVWGNDLYLVGASAPSTRIAYSGTERLTRVRDGRVTEYRAEVRYMKSEGTGRTSLHASFVQKLLPDGSFSDSSDRDPDFLTILNQPFAVTLDPVTLHAIERLRGQVPFQAQSPLGHSTLVGDLRPGTSGLIDGRRVVGVAFEAEGPMAGGLPDRAADAITGTIRMEGTAYYATRDALLLALDARLTITGTLRSGSHALPVRIVYRRAIRASGPHNASKGRDQR